MSHKLEYYSHNCQPLLQSPDLWPFCLAFESSRPDLNKRTKIQMNVYKTNSSAEQTLTIEWQTYYVFYTAPPQNNSAFFYQNLPRYSILKLHTKYLPLYFKKIQKLPTLTAFKFAFKITFKFHPNSKNPPKNALQNGRQTAVQI